VVKASDASGGCVAIHCVAGLGRAPVMVAIALIDKGLDFTAAAELIRKERKGCVRLCYRRHLCVFGELMMVG
jgi:protein tyrosine phosphatase type 4A